MESLIIISCRSWILESGLVESELLNGKFSVGLRDFRPSVYVQGCGVGEFQVTPGSDSGLKLLTPTPTPTPLQLWLNRMYSILTFALVGEGRSHFYHTRHTRFFNRGKTAARSGAVVCIPFHASISAPSRNFQIKLIQVRSPGQVKRPYLKKYLGDPAFEGSV